MKKQNKKTSLQHKYGRPKVTRALCNEVNMDAKIPINIKESKQNLLKLKSELSKNPKRMKSLKYLYTDICNALGIESRSSSHYGSFESDDIECSIRVSNHNANANTYVINLNNNISLKLRPVIDDNRFIPSENVTLEEFVYFDYMINKNKDLITDIIDSLIEYLDTGEYLDKSGQAKKNYSPNLRDISQQRVQQTLQRKDYEDEINRWHMGESKISKINTNKENCNYTYNMKNNKTLRLTESQLHKIVKQSVNNILKENKQKRFNLPDNLYNAEFDEFSDEFNETIFCDYPAFLYNLSKKGYDEFYDEVQEFLHDLLGWNIIKGDEDLVRLRNVILQRIED